MIESTRDQPERSTVVLVHPAATGLAHRLRGSTIEVSSVLDAVGMVARAPTSDPVALVLIPHDVIQVFDDAATAIKRIDPGVRVVMVSREPEARADAAWQVDGVVSARTADDDLRAVLGDGALMELPTSRVAVDRRPASVDAPTPPADFGPTDRPSARDEAPSSIVDPDERSRLLGGEAPEADGNRGTTRLRPPRDDDARVHADRDGNAVDEARESSVPTPTPSNARASIDDAPEPISFAEAVRARESAIENERPREALGDIDLVDSVLEDDRSLLPTAVQLISEQTGWLDLEFVAAGAGPAPTDDRAAADVTEDGHCFGHLYARAADPQELGLWGGWLARWLELGRRHEMFREQSERDPLTGAWNRRALMSFLDRSIVAARQGRRPVTVMLIDIDDFKIYNDRYGHEAGDVILRETVRLLTSVIRNCDRVCRLGGDEFCVVFADFDEPRTAGSTMPDDVAFMVERFQAEVDAMRFPRLGIDAPGRLGVSAGLATFPWDAGDAAGLIRVADQRALESKRAGKNRMTLGPGRHEHPRID